MARGPTIRQKKILETLHDDGSVGVDELSRLLQVSSMTIRRDLSYLESSGYLVRTHGGAIKSQAIDGMFSFERRLHRNRNTKERICAAAAEFVTPASVIFIDCGTTLFRLAGFLRSVDRLRIVTNSLPVVSELGGESGVHLTLTGGNYVPERKALYGRVAEEVLTSVHADLAFIGADGVSSERGLTSFDEKEGAISRSMANASDRVFLLCDSSKIGYSSFYRFGPLTLANAIITDSENDVFPAEVSGIDVIRV